MSNPELKPTEVFETVVPISEGPNGEIAFSRPFRPDRKGPRFLVPFKQHYWGHQYNAVLFEGNDHKILAAGAWADSVRMYTADNWLREFNGDPGFFNKDLLPEIAEQQNDAFVLYDSKDAGCVSRSLTIGFNRENTPSLDIARPTSPENDEPQPSYKIDLYKLDLVDGIYIAVKELELVNKSLKSIH